MSKKPKCFNCKKKLTMVERNLICRCKNNFCIECLLPEKHKCTFDYKNENNLKEKLVKVEHCKVIKI